MLNKRIQATFFILICATVLPFATAFKSAPAKSKLVIRFENYVGKRRMALDTAQYRNALGQAYTITNFKYYISNIVLHGRDGKDYKKEDGYYLIKQDDESTWAVEMEGVPEGSYTGISFLIGVDSLRNCSGAQSGALDPMHGMFWTWNTGYIFFKMEGNSPASKAPGHVYEIHIGGYKEPTNFLRTASLAFEKDAMKVNSGKTTTLYIKTNAAEVMDRPNAIDLSQMYSITDFHHAGLITDNYKYLFSVIRISNEW